MTKDLKEKAIRFKGKEYVQVKDRINYFNESYPNGSITTQLLTPPESNLVVFKACVFPDCKITDRFFTGYSQARWDDKSSFVNASSAMENAETSSVGRALAMMGIGVIDSIASKDEVVKATNYQKPVATESQLTCEKCGSTITKKVADYSFKAFRGQEICMDCQAKERTKTMPLPMAKIINNQVEKKYGSKQDDVEPDEEEMWEPK